jgi:hypothetical protein
MQVGERLRQRHEVKESVGDRCMVALGRPMLLEVAASEDNLDPGARSRCRAGSERCTVFRAGDIE